MPTKCLSKFPLITALALALILSAATASLSGERTGGRMGGSTNPFGTRIPPSKEPTTYSHLSDHHHHYHHHHHQHHHHYDPYPYVDRASSSNRGSTKTDRRVFENTAENYWTQHKDIPVRPKKTVHESPLRNNGSDNTVRSETNDKNESDSWPVLTTVLISGTIIVAVAAVAVWWMWNRSAACVLMLQVGLSGKAISLQRDLNWIARNSNTSDEIGFHQLLLETATVLLDHSGSWISGYSLVEKNASLAECEMSFRNLTFKERKKVDTESLVNVDGVKVEKITNHRPKKDPQKSYIVVTVFVAARDQHTLPEIKFAKDMKTAVKTLSGLSVNQTMAVEVLWTPQDMNDAMLQDEYLENYHLLRPI